MLNKYDIRMAARINLDAGSAMVARVYLTLLTLKSLREGKRKRTPAAVSLAADDICVTHAVHLYTSLKMSDYIFMSYYMLKIHMQHLPFCHISGYKPGNSRNSNA